MIPRKTLVLVILVVVVLIAGGFGFLLLSAPPAPEIPREIVIGVNLPLTGGSAPIGLTGQETLEIWLEEVRAQGGLLVKAYNRRIPVRTILLDDQSNPAISAQNMERLASEGALVVFGPAGTVFALSAAPAAERLGLPIVTVQTSTAELTRRGFKYVFSAYKHFYQDWPVLFDVVENLIPSDRRPRTFAIVADNTAFGREALVSFVDVAKNRGYGDRIVLKENVTAGQTDFTPSILRLRTLNPDVLVNVIFFHSDVFNFDRQMKTNNYYPRLYVGWTAHSFISYADTLRVDSNYAVVTAVTWHPALPYPGSQEFYRKFVAKYNKEPGKEHGADYAALQIIANAIENARSLTRESIREALSNTKMTTILGPVEFMKEGSSDPGRMIAPDYAIQWMNMKQVLIWPREYATGTLAYPAPSWDRR
ncbi:MAG: amino acid ABC transporter substrate-binding protein [Aigarchaeota archaeon]|nr:amino acid ABC transporter substrate-binding protein [Aigarchaeota archaeon]MDW8092287.1 amino acid ABC transporter substrate-binding protein [Nitrososphaerota archaeon]